jgi:hypothetical protein
VENLPSMIATSVVGTVSAAIVALAAAIANSQPARRRPNRSDDHFIPGEPN